MASPFLLVGIPIVVILGMAAIASAKGAVPQGDNKNNPKVPIPFKPLNNEEQTGWRYRGLYVGVYQLDDGSFIWDVYPSVNFSHEPLAEGSWSDEPGALLGATQWIDDFHGGPLA
jgi:hypothetical protein